MNTMTRLLTVLIVSVLVLTINIFAVVNGLYVLPESKAPGTSPASINPWYKLDRYSTSAGYPVEHAASRPPGRRY